MCIGVMSLESLQASSKKAVGGAFVKGGEGVVGVCFDALKRGSEGAVKSDLAVSTMKGAQGGGSRN